MKRLLKYTAIAVALLLVLLIAAPFFIDVDQYRVQIEQRVEDATGRTFHIGDMQASLFPWVGLKLDDVVLGNAEGFKGADFLRVGHLDVQLAFWPLLQQRVELRHFTLEAPALYLQRNSDGRGNWEDLTGSQPQSTAASPATTSSPALAAFTAESISLSKGRLSWSDAVSGRHITLDQLEIQLDDVQQERPVNVHAALTVNGNLLQLNGKIGPIGDLARLDLQRLPLQLQLTADQFALAAVADLLPPLPKQLGDGKTAVAQMQAGLEQRRDGTRLLRADATLKAAHVLTLNLKAEQHDPTHISVQSADLAVDQHKLLNIAGDIKLQSDTPELSLRLRSEPVEREWLTSLLPELAGVYKGHPAPWKTFDVGMMIELKDKALTLSDMKLRLDQELLVLSGRYLSGSHPDLRLNIQGEQLHLDPWLPAARKSQTTADNGKAGPTEEPDLRPYANWRLNVHTELGKLYARGSTMEQVVLNLQGEQGVFQLAPLAFRMAGGSLKLKASVNAAIYPASWNETLTVKQLRVGPLLQQLADSDQLDGTLNMNTRLHGNGLLPDSIKASLSGNGDMEMRDGRVKGFDIAGALRNITSLGQQKGPQYTDFARLQASFTAHHGLIRNNDLFMASPLFRLTGKGTVNVPASAIDYHMRPKLVGTLVGQGDQATSRRGVTIPLHIAGPWASPSITPELDAGALVGNMQNAFKGGSNIGKTLKNAGTSLTNSPDQAVKDRVNKALGGLLPGF